MKWRFIWHFRLFYLKLKKKETSKTYIQYAVYVYSMEFGCVTPLSRNNVM